MFKGLGERDTVTQLLKENVVLKEKVAELEQEREKINKSFSGKGSAQLIVKSGS